MNRYYEKTIMRADFNVPFRNGKITDDFKIRMALPLIKELLKKDCQVLLITHLEQDGKLPHFGFLHSFLEKALKTKIRFLHGEIPVKPAEYGEKIILFDNIRLNPGEIKNDVNFAKRMACWGSYYVNEAFSASHRKHASITRLPRILPSEAGPLFKKEVAELSKFFKPKHPFFFVLGGKKFWTKEPLINKFIGHADAIFIGGALANTFLRERGLPTGKSNVEDIKLPEKLLWHPKIMLPEDAIVLRGRNKKTVLVSDIEKNDIVYDAGPKTVKALSAIAGRSKFVLWNGTLGVCETGFDFGTREFVKSLGKSKAFKLVGGGDTVAAVRKMRLEKNFDFLSTGGGAMLEFLAKGTLPGIEALKKQNVHA